VNSVPDAVASTANFLKKAGWVNGLPWGYEVRLPSGFNASLAGRKSKRPLSSWAAMGVARVDGRPLSGNYAAGIIIPAGPSGPAFIVTKNFDAVYSYNAAESYGLAIALLGDRMKGLPGIQAAWPTDDPPLSRAQRRELQTLLTARGYDVGEPDGKIGQTTRDAIKDVERQIGLEQRGRPGGKVLEALRG
jgi:Transglycosylase SLT domain/Putative peptidoglycan binding domain